MKPKIKKGTRLQRRKTQVVREVVGFTKKPDGIRRARLSDGTSETRVKIDQIIKTYQPV